MLFRGSRGGLLGVFGFENENQLAGTDTAVLPGDVLDELGVGLETLLPVFEDFDLVLFEIDSAEQFVALAFQTVHL